MNNEPILWYIKDNIGHLVLNDPPSNKMSVLFFKRFHRIIEKVKKSKIQALLIYGTGRHFSSGADLKDLLSVISDKSIKFLGKILFKPPFFKMNNRSFLSLSELKIPVIAVIQGVCLGSAMELALSAHFRICTENSLFGFPETSFNLMPGLGGSVRILNFMNYSKALEVILKGETFDANEALRLNLVDKIVKKNIINDEALDLAKKMIKIYKKEKSDE